jgi:hypothetical protein
VQQALRARSSVAVYWSVAIQYNWIKRGGSVTAAVVLLQEGGRGKQRSTYCRHLSRGRALISRLQGARAGARISRHVRR